MKELRKSVSDLGMAAYLMLHGCSVVAKEGKLIYFECNDETDEEAIDNLILEYQPPNDFITFDNCLMFLKKLNDKHPKTEEGAIKLIPNLGQAAYILLHECREQPENRLNAKVVGKKGKNIYFRHPEEMSGKLTKLANDYFLSQFYKYDQELQGIKKYGEYNP